MRLGYRPATCPPATAGQGHTPFTRPPRCSAGSAHPLYWGFHCFCATKPKRLSGAHACCSNTSNVEISLFFWLGFYKQRWGIPNTFALWESVICILYRCTDKNDTMYRNRVWKHLPLGPWSSRSLQRQRGALGPFIQKPDRPLCWQTLSIPRNTKKNDLSGIDTHTHTREFVHLLAVTSRCSWTSWRCSASVMKREKTGTWRRWDGRRRWRMKELKAPSGRTVENWEEEEPGWRWRRTRGKCSCLRKSLPNQDLPQNLRCTVNPAAPAVTPSPQADK